MEKKVLWGLAILLCLIFVLRPLPTSDLIVRVYFEDITGDCCVLYYITEDRSEFSDEQKVVSEIDPVQKKVEFRLDGSFEGHITNLRLDFPHLNEQLICVKSITVSSAGVVRKDYNPCNFFMDENIESSHEASVTLVYPRNRAYISAGSDDPYIVLSPALVKQIGSYYSHRTFSRVALCLFLFGAYMISKRKIFI